MIKEKLFRKKYIPVKNVDIKEGMVIKCKKCNKLVFKEDLVKSIGVCPECGEYFNIKARDRLKLVLDEGSFKEEFKKIKGFDPLNFPDYPAKQKVNRMKSGLSEGVVTGIGKIDAVEVAIGVMDSNYLMGSMGIAVGEKITKLIELSTEKKLPLIIFTASGGARMQEGMFSLMQMAKTSQALKIHSREGNLYISILTHPTTGGVSASFATLGDIILAEKRALIGFAGPRVIEQVTHKKLPEGFQRSEFLLEKGQIDRIVERVELKKELSEIIKIHGYK